MLDKEDWERLKEIQETMGELLEEAKNIVRMSGDKHEYERAKAYWLAYIDNAIDSAKSPLLPCTMGDTIAALDRAKKRKKRKKRKKMSQNRRSNNQFAREFADAARLLLGGNGDFRQLAKDLGRLVAEYDGVDPELFDNYNKLLEIADCLTSEQYEKFSSQGTEGEAPPWNSEELSKLPVSQFYFYAGQAPKLDRECYGIQTWVIICPKPYFDKHGCVIDRHISDYTALLQNLPEGLGEESEAMFSSGKSVDETRRDLLKVGFIESGDFSNWCKNHDPFCESDDFEGTEIDWKASGPNH